MSSESALLASTAVRLRLCRRSREGYGGGGSCGMSRRGPSDTIATGGCGDMAGLGCAWVRKDTELNKLWGD